MSARPRWIQVAALAAVGALAVAACSDDGPVEATSAQDVLVAAPGRTIDAGSSRIAVLAELEGQARGTFDGQGEFEFGPERGRLEVDLGPLGLAGAGRTEVLLDGDVVYIELGQRLPGLGGRPWVRIDLDDLAGGEGDNIEALRQLKVNDPGAVMNYLRGADGDAVELGGEEVRGTATTHYRATVDLDRARESSPEAVRDDLAEVIRQLGTDRLPVEAWVDADGRLRRLRYTVDLAALSDDAPAKGAGRGRATASLELYEFGVDVTVTPPPEAEVTDIGALLGTGAGR